MTATVARLLLLLAAACLLAPTAAQAVDCNARQGPLNTAITVTLDPATSWQPRGGQVRFVVDSKTQSLAGLDVVACFRWAGAKDYLSPAAVRVVDDQITTTSELQEGGARMDRLTLRSNSFGPSGPQFTTSQATPFSRARS